MGIDPPQQRMGGIDFVVRGADHEQLLPAAVSTGREHVERRRVEPLRSSRKSAQRMFRRGEDAEKPPEHTL